MICPYLEAPKYFILADGLPPLLYYSHIPSIVISLFIGAFVFFHGPRSLPNILLFCISIFFSLWAFLDLIVWTNINSDVITFTWSLFGLLYSLICVSSIYFISSFLRKGADIGWLQKTVFVLLLLPVLIFTPTAQNISGFDLDLCGSSGFEGVPFFTYYTLLGGVAMLWILVLLVWRFLRSDTTFRKQVVLMGLGIEFFLFAFLTTGFFASYLNDAGILTDYSLEYYGLFGMTAFMVIIGFLIVRFRAFNAGMIAAQALIFALIALIGSQFTFVTSMTHIVLVGITLILTAVAGIVLIRSVKREIEQRVRIEKLAQDLARANNQQVTLIHFITHQIKGFVTKSRNIFAMMKEGEFGQMPETARDIINQGFESDTKGLNTIQEILNAANIKSGKVTFTMAPFDLKSLIESIAKDLAPAAAAKGLALNLHLGDEPLIVNGDSAQLVNAYKNLVDNSIKYTPSGSVTLDLMKRDGKAVFTVSDTGVGITPEDMKNLFTEGGHGKESTKINVDSTGFGLYIVKNIVEAHKGRVWAESEGAGKGSRFIVELPA